MGSVIDSPPRVAIIRNYTLDADWGQQMLDSIADLVRTSRPDASVEFFAPIDDEGSFPDATAFDLVILTGGVMDLTVAEEEYDPWVSKMMVWVREAVGRSPVPKLLDICWAHQLIARALGGEIVYLDGPANIDVQKTMLTPRGSKIFGESALRLHKFHKRIVSSPPPALEDISSDGFHEIMLSKSSQIMTFQGHPEMTASIAQSLVDHGDSSYLSDPTPEGIQKLHRDLEKEEDGKRIWPMIMTWSFGSAGV